MLILRIYHPHAHNVGVRSNVTAYLPKELQAKIFEFEWVRSNTMFDIEYINDPANNLVWKGIGPVKRKDIKVQLAVRIHQSLRDQGIDVVKLKQQY